MTPPGEYDPYASVVVCAGRSGVEKDFMDRWLQTGPREECPTFLRTEKRKRKHGFPKVCVRCGCDFEAVTPKGTLCALCRQDVRVESGGKGGGKGGGYHATG